MGIVVSKSTESATVKTVLLVGSGAGRILKFFLAFFSWSVNESHRLLIVQKCQPEATLSVSLGCVSAGIIGYCWQWFCKEKIHFGWRCMNCILVSIYLNLWVQPRLMLLPILPSTALISISATAAAVALPSFCLPPLLEFCFLFVDSS